jgi:hypothetical protein
MAFFLTSKKPVIHKTLPINLLFNDTLTNSLNNHHQKNHLMTSIKIKHDRNDSAVLTNYKCIDR